jgi:hypothetical protein
MPGKVEITEAAQILDTLGHQENACEPTIAEFGLRKLEPLITGPARATIGPDADSVDSSSPEAGGMGGIRTILTVVSNHLRDPSGVARPDVDVLLHAMRCLIRLLIEKQQDAGDPCIEIGAERWPHNLRGEARTVLGEVYDALQEEEEAGYARAAPSELNVAVGRLAVGFRDVLYRCTTAVLLRKGLELDDDTSPRNGGMEAGTVFRALEREHLAVKNSSWGPVPEGRMRIRCRRGWLSEVDDEGKILVSPATMADFVASPEPEPQPEPEPEPEAVDGTPLVEPGPEPEPDSAF